MKKFVLLVLALFSLSSCTPSGEKFYLEGTTEETERAIYSHDSSTITAETASIDITVTRKNADIQALDFIEASDGVFISYWPSAISYNGTPLTLGEEANEYGFLILNIPITDDQFTLHVDYDLTNRATGADWTYHVTEMLAIDFCFDCTEFKAMIY